MIPVLRINIKIWLDIFAYDIKKEVKKNKPFECLSPGIK